MSNTVKIMLFGCNGKMGQVVYSLVCQNEDVDIVCGVDINTERKNGFPVYANPYEYSDRPDVIIDFSHPSSLALLLSYAVENEIPCVIATTGLSNEHKKALDDASKHIPVFFSANMSLGINLLLELVAKAASFLEDDFDIEIIEKHHNQKIDAPSGTALMIADTISEACSKPKEYVYDRHSVRRKRDKNEIGIHAVRGGTIVGEHSVIFAGHNEIIEISHTAMSKEIFAAGAIRAARFIIGKPSGMYDMKSLVNNI